MKVGADAAGVRSSLERARAALADRCGIVSEFTDARGQPRMTSSETQRALLRAIGLDAETEISTEKAIEEIDRSEWSEIVPPVCVLHQGGAASAYPVTLPEGTSEFGWSLTTEDGSLREGVEQFSNLRILSRRSIAGEMRERRRWEPGELPCGYHQLVINGQYRSRLIVAPPACWLPPALHRGTRLWGVSTQLYLVKSRRNWGIGDFGDLRSLVDLLRPLGADVIGVNPLHALFLDDPDHASPYSPASRLLLNVLNIDVTQVVEMTPELNFDDVSHNPQWATKLTEARQSSHVDYQKVTELKLTVLRQCFSAWLKMPAAERWSRFEQFRREAGSRFERDITFLALRDHLSRARGGATNWREWPAEFKTPSGEGVVAFAAEEQESITWHAWLQYHADRQLGSVAAAAKGMAIGLYRDLAVGTDAAGAETWANSTAVAADVCVGAPPDIHNPAGQNWGLPPLNPRALRAEGYESFIALVRANMKHAGALRIDHVMGLLQLYWVPQGASAAQGAYVRYPLDDLVGILKLESTRHRCAVVGEDLGTVPGGFREAMAEANILSYRVLFFEKTAEAYVVPAAYPRLAVAVAGSHDLPTVRAWWQGADIALKAQLHLYPGPEDARRAQVSRETDRQQLMKALRDQGLVTEAADGEQLFEAIHRYLARTSAAITLVQLDDATDELAPVNLPTTTDEYANWRRKLSLDLDQLRDASRFQAVAAICQTERGTCPDPRE